jgi:hypothetical protein
LQPLERIKTNVEELMVRVGRREVTLPTLSMSSPALKNVTELSSSVTSLTAVQTGTTTPDNPASTRAAPPISSQNNEDQDLSKGEVVFF